MLAGDLPPPRRGHQDHTTHSESTPRLLRAGSPTPRRQQHTDWSGHPHPLGRVSPFGQKKPTGDTR